VFLDTLASATEWLPALWLPPVAVAGHMPVYLQLCAFSHALAVCRTWTVHCRVRSLLATCHPAVSFHEACVRRLCRKAVVRLPQGSGLIAKP
jgi:hypothetical protein